MRRNLSYLIAWQRAGLLKGRRHVSNCSVFRFHFKTKGDTIIVVIEQVKESGVKECVVARAASAVPLGGQIEQTPWAEATPLAIDQYPWYDCGAKHPTTVRLLYDEQFLYAQFHCADTHISAVTTKLNGPVSVDSCVEFFATIEPDRRPHYFNLEINCCGTVLLGFNDSRQNRLRNAAEATRRIGVATSLPGPTKRESPDDDGWWLAAALPFDVLSELAGVPVQPRSATAWRANFYRCGGQSDPQHACWSPIDAAAHSTPDFHRPEYFGRLRFA